MDFTTKVNIPQSNIYISHTSHILMMGSCFTESIGKQLIDNKFNVNLNPFGILYNPASISQALQMLIDKQQLMPDDLFIHNGLYHSFWHHGSFSGTDNEKCLENINLHLEKASSDIRNVDILIITFGTAYVFQSKTDNRIVSNCHKLPANMFDRYRLDVDMIVSDWTQLINRLQSANPLLQIIFTVSPIRHLKDGAHDNQLSKSTLLLAIDKILKETANTSYFPSYEIVLDELRDYRFYKEDMVHPSDVAVKYIWDRFSQTYLSEEAHPIIQEWRKLHLALKHRPINQDSEEHKVFLRQTLLKLKAFNQKYPYICCNDDISDLEKRV